MNPLLQWGIGWATGVFAGSVWTIVFLRERVTRDTRATNAQARQLLEDCRELEAEWRRRHAEEQKQEPDAPVVTH